MLFFAFPHQVVTDNGKVGFLVLTVYYNKLGYLMFFNCYILTLGERATAKPAIKACACCCRSQRHRLKS